MAARRWACVVALVALVATGCWEQPGFDSGGSNASWLPVGVNASNVSSLQHAFTGPASALSGTAHSVVSGGHLFVASERLSSYDASGVDGCTGTRPSSCTPQWRSVETTGSSEPIVVGGGRVWMVTNTAVAGYDVDGQQGCGGAPRQCSPIVSIPSPGYVSGLRWSDGALLMTVGTGPFHQFSLWQYVFGSDGVERWRAPLGGPTLAPWGPLPVGAAGIVYTTTLGNGIVAFDVAGVSGCSGVPKVCTPLRRYEASGTPVVAGGRVYAAVTGGHIGAFDAAGVAGCSGQPVVCEPLWSTSAAGFAPAVTADHLYAVQSDRVAVYSLGTTGCDGSPLVCAPLWTDAPTGAPYTVGNLSVAGGVVYTTSQECPGGNCSDPIFRVDAHDAAGQVACSGSPKVCTSRWSTTVPYATDAVMIVGDSVYVPLASSGVLGSTPPGVWAFRPATT